MSLNSILRMLRPCSLPRRSVTRWIRLMAVLTGEQEISWTHCSDVNVHFTWSTVGSPYQIREQADLAGTRENFKPDVCCYSGVRPSGGPVFGGFMIVRESKSFWAWEPSADYLTGSQPTFLCQNAAVHASSSRVSIMSTYVRTNRGSFEVKDKFCRNVFGACIQRTFFVAGDPTAQYGCFWGTERHLRSPFTVSVGRTDNENRLIEL